MLKSMGLKHRRYLQRFVGAIQHLGHGTLPDPVDRSLRETMLGCEVELEAGLQCEREGGLAGSLLYTPSLALPW